MNFFLKVLSAKSGVSSKRFIGILGSLSMIVIAFVDLFTGFTVTDYIYDGLMWLSLGGLSVITAERFADAMNARYQGKALQNQQANPLPPDQQPLEPGPNP